MAAGRMPDSVESVCGLSNGKSGRESAARGWLARAREVAGQTAAPVAERANDFLLTGTLRRTSLERTQLLGLLWLRLSSILTPLDRGKPAASIHVL